MSVRRSSLANGLRIATDKVHDAQSISLAVHVGAGARDEAPDEHGIAHCLEHMAFKGTQSRSAYEIAAGVERLGGEINAETSAEATTYSVRMMAEDWQTGIDVLADIVLNPLFREADLALEKDVIRQEIAGAFDNPDERVIDLLSEAAHGDGAMGRSILGSDESVAAITPERLQGFRTRTYAASDILVVAAGNIDHDRLADAADRYFGGLRMAAPKPRAGSQFAGKRIFEPRPTNDVHMALAWPAPAFGDLAVYPHGLAVQCLGGGMTSRLFQTIREKEGLAYGVDAFAWSFSDCGLGLVEAATGPRHLPRLLELLARELCALDVTLTEDDLTAAKRQLLAALAMSGESLPARAGRLARQIQLLGRPVPFDEIVDAVKAVTLDQVRAHWADIRDAGDAAIAMLGPETALKAAEGWRPFACSAGSPKMAETVA